MRTIPLCLLIVHLTSGVAVAQSFSDLQIAVRGYWISSNGGERPAGVSFVATPVVIGKPTTTTFSIGDSCTAFTVSSDGSLRENATTAWRIEVTPLKVERGAVTFRLRWRQFPARMHGGEVSLDAIEATPTRREDLELTLGPGQSWPVDTIPGVIGTKTVHGEPCSGPSSIRVLVDHYPSADVDRRLINVDLWLMERVSGSDVQRGQPISLRGLPSRPVRFYFDRVTDANLWLDIYGTLTARLERDAIALALETRSRWDESWLWKSVNSSVSVKPAEIVDVRLPPLGEGPFAKREFSIRVRARQLR